MAGVTYETLEHVAMEGRPYPTHLLEGCETGLVLFAAAFLGHNDAVHFAEAGLRTTCVDIDSSRLMQMKMLYPPTWEWHGNQDAWEFAENEASMGHQWDAVSADTFTGDLAARSLDSLDLWCSLASRFVTATIVPEDVEELNVPEGWESSLYPRSERVSWLVLTRAGTQE